MKIKKPKPVAREGLVVFIDILGYQNFIDNNNVEKAVAILNRVFTGLDRAIVEDYKNSWANKRVSVDRLKQVRHQILSDSVILHLESENTDAASLNTDWISFLQTVRVVQRRLFENGFPARGAVASGKYYLGEGFLVGKPFMDAYRLSGQLEFAGTAVTPAALTQFEKSFEESAEKIVDYRGGVQFLAPLKGNREERLYCLSPLRFKEADSLARDLHAFVNKAFWAHQKDVPVSVDAKVSNTIKFLNYWMCRVKKS